MLVSNCAVAHADLEVYCALRALDPFPCTTTHVNHYKFITSELSLINACCWRAYHEILVHGGESLSELTFVYARHVLISKNSPVRKNYFDPNIII